MPYVVKVDLSAKIEQWSKNTAVAFSDSSFRGSIWVDSGVKKAARDWLKAVYPGRSQAYYRYLLFAVFIYLLIRPHLRQIRQIVIDRDYSGRKSKESITNFLFNFLQRDDPSLRGGFIDFQRVKGSEADRLARDIFEKGKRGEHGADREISLVDIKAVFPKKK